MKNDVRTGQITLKSVEKKAGAVPQCEAAPHVLCRKENNHSDKTTFTSADAEEPNKPASNDTRKFLTTSRFVDNHRDIYMIYQLQKDAPADLLSAEMDRPNVVPDRGNYETIYTGNLQENKNALEKPAKEEHTSILERLKQPLPKQANKTAPHRSAEMEI